MAVKSTVEESSEKESKNLKGHKVSSFNLKLFNIRAVLECFQI